MTSYLALDNFVPSSRGNKMSVTVILGAGIIGVSTAYYVSDHQPPSSIHLVETSPELFASASGFAAGFLAKDWFGSALASLGSLSFEQHRSLAEKYRGRERWGYSASTAVSYAAAPRGQSGKRGEDWLREGRSRAGVAPSTTDDMAGRAPPWLQRQVGDQVELIGDDDTAAQV